MLLTSPSKRDEGGDHRPSREKCCHVKRAPNEDPEWGVFIWIGMKKHKANGRSESTARDSTGDNAQKSNTRHSQYSCPLAFPTVQLHFFQLTTHVWNSLCLKGSYHTFSKLFGYFLFSSFSIVHLCSLTFIQVFGPA